MGLPRASKAFIPQLLELFSASAGSAGLEEAQPIAPRLDGAQSKKCATLSVERLGNIALLRGSGRALEQSAVHALPEAIATIRQAGVGQLHNLPADTAPCSHSRSTANTAPADPKCYRSSWP